GSADTQIFGFEPLAGEVVDLTAIDAIPGTPAHDPFSFIGEAGFDGTAGQLRWEHFGYQEVPQYPDYLVPEGWQLMGDTDGDGAADLSILLRPGADPELYLMPAQAGWFVL
ncbi:MAG: hypothetical protein Q8M47_11265, partial [Devosia sp.]|nr:hypothetical protein [Devosia sp.]